MIFACGSWISEAAIDGVVFALQMELPQSGELDVVVTDVVDAGQFWVRRCDGGTTRALRSIMESIRHRNLLPLSGDPSRLRGMFCLSIFSEDGEYYRAHVDSVNLHVNRAEVGRKNWIALYFILLYTALPSPVGVFQT